jgi:hypothetical protein
VKCGLPEREEGTVTVVCALKDNEQLFLAADSLLGGLPVEKLSSGKIETYTREGVHLAWASSGDETIGDQFSDSLKRSLQQTSQAFGWDELIDLCVPQLAQLNGIIREAKLRNRIPLDPENDFAQVLLVGYIGEQPEIVHFEPTGGWTLHLRAGREFAAIGGGRYHAAMTYELLRERNLLLEDKQAAIREVAELAARYAPLCCLPVEVIKVMPSGVEFAENGEVEST